MERTSKSRFWAVVFCTALKRYPNATPADAAWAAASLADKALKEFEARRDKGVFEE